MKWLALFVILISVNGIFGDEEEEDSCMNVYRNCDYPYEDFPENSDELLKICQGVQEYGKCILGVRQTTCENNEFNAFVNQHIRSTVGYLETTCEKNNPTFEVISSNLQCIERAIERGTGHCGFSMSDKNMELLESHIMPYLEDDAEITKCLFRLMDATCDSVTVGHRCGENVKEAVDEVLSYVDDVRLHCTEEQLEELELIQEVFKEVFTEELLLQDAVEGKRK